MALQVWHNKAFVGRIDSAFEHQGTWFGDLHAGGPDGADTQAQRVGDFIDFCREWYAREGSPAGADATEFDAFDDIVRSGLWYTIDEAGRRAAIADAPVFMDGRDGEMSWTART